MSPTVPNAATAIGFLTILQEAGGYVGGYLVTNGWGRPLEFRLSSAVQPNKVQQILYGGTLVPYVCADLIGKTLVDRAGVSVQLIVTDREAVLDLRLKADAPVLYLAPPEEESKAAPNVVRQGQPGRGPLLCHPRYPGDAAMAQEMLERLETGLDLAEPFVRIREAVAEARKMGVTGK